MPVSSGSVHPKKPQRHRQTVSGKTKVFIRPWRVLEIQSTQSKNNDGYDSRYAHTLMAMLNGLSGVKVIDILLSLS